MFLKAQHLVRTAYVFIALLLLSTVALSYRFRTASSWRQTPEYLKLDDRTQQLAAIRKFVLQGTTALRDFLINNHGDADEAFNEEIRRSKGSTTKAFLALNDWTAQRASLEQLDRELAEYWGLLDRNRPETPKEKEDDGFDLLHDRVLPARRDVLESIRLLEERVIADRAIIAQQAAHDRNVNLTTIFAVMGLTLAISLLLASGNQQFRQRSQLESRRKFEEMALARDSLEQLSGRLLRIQEDERRKISRELHDGIGQTLTALRMEIHQVHFLAVGGFSGGEERLLRARKLAEEAVETVKDISLLLRPPLLDDLGLEPALVWLTDQFNRRTGIKSRFRAVEVQEHLPDDIKTCVFRVIQEALNNCEKHASPTGVDIVVEQTSEWLSISVEDDGAGFALSQQNTPARHAGLGILGMRERAVLLGGTLTIKSSPGLGTRLEMKLPVAKFGAARDVPKLFSTPVALRA